MSDACVTIPTESDQLSCSEYLSAALFPTCILCNDIAQPIRFVIDSGASTHMVPYEYVLCDVTTAVRGLVSLGDNNKKLVISGAGHTAIPMLGRVLYVPELSFGLISISALDKVGCKTLFQGGKVFVFVNSGELLLTGTLVDKLYFLDEVYVNALTNVSQCAVYPVVDNVMLVDHGDDVLYYNSDRLCISECSECGVCCVTEENSCCTSDDVTLAAINSECACTVEAIASDTEVRGTAPSRLKAVTLGRTPLEAIHARWGHLGVQNIKNALKHNMVKGSGVKYDDIKNDTMPICFDCMRGRMKVFTPPSPVVRDYKPFDKVAIDYKGKFPLSVHKNNGFYLISDASTNLVRAYACKSRHESVMLNILNAFRTEIVEMYGYHIGKLQSDFDTVVLSDAVHRYLVANKIRLQLSAPYSHAQNGQIERDMQNVLDRARTMMSVYNVPKKYWEYAVVAACYLINRSPTTGHDKTPYELVTGEKPDISLLVPFYAPGIFHLTKEERSGTFDYKAVRCRMLGYDERCKDTYVVLTIPTGSVISRKDCIFDEHQVAAEFACDDIAFQLDNDNDVDYVYDLNGDIINSVSISGSEFSNHTYLNNYNKNNHHACVVDNNDHDHVVDNLYENSFFTWDTDEYITTINDHLSRQFVYHIAVFVHGAVRLPKDPTDVDEALAGPEGDNWREAIRKEFNNFDVRSVFGEAPQTGRAMKTKLILKYAYNNDYSIKYKARLVACGYSQIYGIDYKETYAPTTSGLLVNMIFHIGAMCEFHFASFDVSAAFLEGKNDIVQFARLPFNLSDPTSKVGTRVEVIGNFYGEKQGPKIWNDQLDNILTGIGFVRCPAHPCLYKLTVVDDDGFIVLTVHVDDGLMITNDDDMYTEFEELFSKRVIAMSVSRDFKRFLGLDVKILPCKNGDRVELSHSLYILARYSEYTKSKTIPMSSTANLRDAVPNSSNESLLGDTGAFRFIADRARPDILVVAGELATGGANSPSDLHVKTSERVKHYLNGTADLCLTLGGLGKLAVFGYSDASYITTGNCKSRLGGCVFLGYDSGAVYSYSKNDTVMSTVSHSSTESEIKAIDELVRTLQHILDLLKFIVGEVELPVKVFVDNTSAIALLESLKGHNKVKHINVRIAYIRELIMSGMIELHFVPTEFNVADILTKPLSIKQFLKLRDILMRGHGGVMPSWEELHSAITALYLEVDEDETE